MTITTTATTWHEDVKAAALRLYGSVCGSEIERVDLGDYRGMSPDDAIVAIVAACRDLDDESPDAS